MARRQMHSCDTCRRRKVRCDSEDDRPCTACHRSGVECSFTVGWRRRKVAPRGSHAPPPPACTPDTKLPAQTRHLSLPSLPSVPSLPSLAPKPGRAQPPSPASSLASALPKDPRSSASPRALTHSSPPRPAHASQHQHQHQHQHHANRAPAADARPVVPSPIPPEEVALSIDIAENGLHRFFRDGLSSSSWCVFDAPDSIRTAYVGTHISNMTHLVRLDEPRPQYLLYPYPQIRPPLYLNPKMRKDAPASSAHVNQANRLAMGLPSTHDILSFPETEIRDNFIDAYFSKVNPFFPVIDELDFRAQYTDPNPDKQPPLLLLHAVLLVGAHVSTHPKANEARHIIKAVLFRRAKCVFDMRHEQDRVQLIQAALLFTWHLQNGDTASCNSSYWLGVGCRIAFGLGLHRSLRKDPLLPDRMPVCDRRLWRRIWWMLFQAEVFSALEHGRPSAIRREDFDQEPLSLDDFIEVSGRRNDRLHPGCLMRQVELSHVALEIVNLSSPGIAASLVPEMLRMRTDDLNAQLVQWMLAQPLSSASRGADFGDVLLRIQYHTLVIHLYRLHMGRSPLETNVPNDAPLPDMAHATMDAESHGRIISNASAEIVSCFETLQDKTMLAQCPFLAVTALTAASIHIARDVQQALQALGSGAVSAGQSQISMLLVVHGLCLLERACVVAERLSVYWPNAGGVRRVFRSLHERFTTALNGIRGGLAVAQTDAEHQGGGPLDPGLVGGVDWTDILLDQSWHVTSFFENVE